ncbi:MAG: TetR/AcrR family transcriptional regulator [Chloroflexi bacterium]|nr:MAG: TetR/AcrR family transcriptional regulator [Chloroflexota bacterium]
MQVSSQTPAERKPRPGGRSARVRAAVLHAAFDELGEKGYDGFNMEAVARRSGVHKTTVYRRWPTRDALVVDALDSRGDRHSPISVTGSLRADLRVFAEDVFAKLSSPHGKAMLKSLVSAVDQSPEILEKVESFWRERLDAGAAVIEWGIDRGELPPGIDVDLVIEGLLAPIYLRVLLSGQSVTADFLEQLIELLLDGALHRLASRRPASEAQSPGAAKERPSGPRDR